MLTSGKVITALYDKLSTLPKINLKINRGASLEWTLISIADSVTVCPKLSSVYKECNNVLVLI